MDKLIELLNEYNWQDSYWLDEDSISKEKYINRWDGRQCFIDEHIISKRFGFIKWLVDNDKIDRDRCECRQLYNALKRSENEHWDKNFSKCERIIMLLAIQDEPIEFLCSILK